MSSTFFNATMLLTATVAYALAASAFGESTTRLWDASTGQRVTNSAVLGSNSVPRAMFSRDGQLVATMSSDGRAQLWDTAIGTKGQGGVDEQNWTLRWRGARYGFIAFGDNAIWPRNAFVVWNSKAYRSPFISPWVILLAAAVLIGCGGAAAYGSHQGSLRRSRR